MILGRVAPSLLYNRLPLGVVVGVVVLLLLFSSRTATAFTSIASPKPAQHATTPLSLSSSSSSPSSSSSNDEDDDDDDTFMKSLQSRMAQVQDSDTMVPIVVLDAMLPRQVLKIQVDDDDPTFPKLVRHCLAKEHPHFGMVGTATLANNGQTWPLQNGVQVEFTVAPPPIAKQQQQDDVVNDDAGGGLRVKLTAGRRFRIVQNQVTTHPAGWTQAKVEFLDATMERREDPSLETAVQVATQLTTSGLIDAWIGLATTREHFPGQIDQLLVDLGPQPSPDDPSDLAFWVGALINPIPGMGVAMEIRPQLLMAKTAQERIGTVYSAIEASIHHMDGSKPLF